MRIVCRSLFVKCLNDVEELSDDPLLIAMSHEMSFFLVYRLDEYGSLLQEGGVGLSVWALRAGSYKTKAEA